jgi:hypothetical protein
MVQRGGTLTSDRFVADFKAVVDRIPSDEIAYVWREMSPGGSGRKYVLRLERVFDFEGRRGVTLVPGMEVVVQLEPGSTTKIQAARVVKGEVKGAKPSKPVRETVH